jgi:hypothetical protein
MVGAYASFLNIGQKGNAEKSLEMGKVTFGEEAFLEEVERCVKHRGWSLENLSGTESMPVSEK